MTETYSLAILELLIQKDGCRRIDELWSILASKFQRCSDFFSIVGPTPDALEMFIEQQPALFREDSPPRVCHNGFKRNNSEHISNSGIEMEAVKYFQDQLLRKPERWIPIKSLAGHLSQASPSIRMIVGPQAEFARFLHRYPLFFQIQGELVGLSDKIRTHWNGGQPTFDPRKQGATERFQLPMHLQMTQTIPESTIKCRSSNIERNVIALSIEDCKALLWLMHAVAQEHTESLPFASLLSEISCAPKSVHNSIGWTQIELQEFLKKYDKIFKLDEILQTITQHPTNSLHLMIVNKTQSTEDSNVLLAKRGCIFCVNRLWGIIDLGFHEHVFFDRSLFKHVTDLSKHFQVGLRLFSFCRFLFSPCILEFHRDERSSYFFTLGQAPVSWHLTATCW
ncbi:unnamed protein product [Echinostoma caproni]|uniref:HTH OST-type domain-containing protein n=1 Tax=Echinostoma caproni TaxID=27848 RepID=A0A183A7N1_9TREM|nr:unnamed protein product [Echinostoma caproni]